MAQTQGVEFQASEWLRGPGHLFEIKSASEKLEVAGLDPNSILDKARSLYNAVAALNEINPEDLLHNARVLTWIAASLGHPEACVILADEIGSYIEEKKPSKADGLIWREIAKSWEARSRGEEPNAQKPRSLRLRATRPEDVADEPANPPSNVAADLKDLLATSEEAETVVVEDQGLVVVPSVGDETSSEGASLSRRFSKIVGRALPSKIVMPQPGVIATTIKNEWPWAEKVGVHIENMLFVQRAVGVKRPRLKPMLFVGPPGSGKTALAMRVAELFGLPTWMVATGSTSDAAGLAAVTRGWAGSRPCGPVIAAAQGECCDPAIIIDELDKGVGPGSRNGSVSGTLLGMLGTPEKFQDSCLLADLNLSKMVFMATSNSLEAIAPALLDRFAVLLVPRPSKSHFQTVLKNIRAKVARDLGVRTEMLPVLSADEYEVLKRQFERQDGSLRDFQRAFDYMLSQAAQRETVGTQIYS